ncbi:MAG TPA: hypothetical protein VE258_08575 [Ktedonobacterales bacterium]|nr:hypothetical protein [Ktedonobacterales bacterium]
MAHTITLTDEQFERLRAAARLSHRTPEQVVADLLAVLPAASPPVSPEEYDRRWEAFLQLAGSIRDGTAMTSEEIDELIGEEAADRHFARAGFIVLL